MKLKDMKPGCKYIRTEPVKYSASFWDYSFCDAPIIFVKIEKDGSPIFKSVHLQFNLGKPTIFGFEMSEKYYNLPLEFDDDNWKLYTS